MSQISFSDAEYAGKRKKTRREVFLEEMEQVVPWKALLKVIEPHYPVAGRGRRPYPLDAMLRVHLMQNWFALSDPAMEEALYEIASLRNFAGLSLSPAFSTKRRERRWVRASTVVPVLSWMRLPSRMSHRACCPVAVCRVSVRSAGSAHQRPAPTASTTAGSSAVDAARRRARWRSLWAEASRSSSSREGKCSRNASA